jgi:4-hydroxy-tetrahydrodipicolinate reductase
MSLTAALEQAGHPGLGHDIGELAGCGRMGVRLSSEWNTPADILIDFSSPASAVSRAAEAELKRTAILIGTTGLSEAQRKTILAHSHNVPVLIAPNMSVGVNLLFRLAGEVAKALGEEYDVEIIEVHHRMKKDAPSGTAVRLAEEIAAATGRTYAGDVVHGRHGLKAERREGEIGMHAVRAGDVVGDHTVMFCALGERIELTHRAHTRDTFARGAIRAAKFLAGKKPGIYTMRDVLGIGKQQAK